jgi:hypothetical protein
MDVDNPDAITVILVDDHRGHLSKLGLVSRTQACLRAVREGLGPAPAAPKGL